MKTRKPYGNGSSYTTKKKLERLLKEAKTRRARATTELRIWQLRVEDLEKQILEAPPSRTPGITPHRWRKINTPTT